MGTRVVFGDPHCKLRRLPEGQFSVECRICRLRKGANRHRVAISDSFNAARNEWQAHTFTERHGSLVAGGGRDLSPQQIATAERETQRIAREKTQAEWAEKHRDMIALGLAPMPKPNPAIYEGSVRISDVAAWNEFVGLG